MAEAILQKEACENCGADVRPETQFCYNCGTPVVDAASTEVEPDVEAAEPAAEPLADESKASLVDLENALASEFPPSAVAKPKLEAAAAERRRARKSFRKTPEIVWEPAPEGSKRIYILVVTLIFVAAAAIVFMTVFLK